MEGPFAGAREKVNRMYAALNIYASLAEKAGMNLIKNDLENKAFEYLMPEEHNRITAQLKEREERDLGVLRQASSEVRQVRRSLGDTSCTGLFGWEVQSLADSVCCGFCVFSGADAGRDLHV